jgi:heme-degrading monooxygenase HmoA
MDRRFKHVYGPEGDWVRLFRQDGFYIGTELVCELKGERTYLTLDYWTSEEAYDAFRARHLDEYRVLDQKCEGLTESEREIGRFVRVPSD